MEKPTQLNSVYIAAYAPYSLQIYYEGTNGNINSMGDDIIDDPDYIGKVLRLNLDNNTVYCEDCGIGLELEICNIKPILRPLSDLNVVIDWPDGRYAMTYKNITTQRQIGAEGYKTIQSYIKRHFDVFCLIDAGLAIDINTLNK